MEKTLNLYQRINKVMDDVQYLQKDDRVGSGTYAYKAISIEKVTEAVREAMVRHGLVILPVEQTHIMEDKARTNNQGAAVIVPITTVDVKYKIVNIDNPTEFETVVSSGTGVDPQDKGVGKAMTYSYKNLLLRMFAIPTGDDTDKTHNKDLEKEQNALKESAAAKPITEVQHTEIIELLKSPAQTEETVNKVTNKLPNMTHAEAEKTKLFLKKQIAMKAEQNARKVPEKITVNAS